MGFDKAGAARGLPLYVSLVYAGVAQAIEMRASRLVLGRTALGPKAQIGAKPQAMYATCATGAGSLTSRYRVSWPCFPRQNRLPIAIPSKKSRTINGLFHFVNLAGGNPCIVRYRAFNVGARSIHMSGYPEIREKLMTPEEAVRRFIKDGCQLALGGSPSERNPMALAREIIRQDIKDLHIVCHSHGQALDLLIGAKCVKRLEVAYGANGRFAST